MINVSIGKLLPGPGAILEVGKDNPTLMVVTSIVNTTAVSGHTPVRKHVVVNLDMVPWVWSLPVHLEIAATNLLLFYLLESEATGEPIRVYVVKNANRVQDVTDRGACKLGFRAVERALKRLFFKEENGVWTLGSLKL